MSGPWSVLAIADGGSMKLLNVTVKGTVNKKKKEKKKEKRR